MLLATTSELVLACAALGQVPADEPFPAHKIVGNVYYDGSKDLASYLISTPEGHILINSGFEQTVRLIRIAVESLGFRMRDIKVLLASHAHADHGAAEAIRADLSASRPVEACTLLLNRAVELLPLTSGSPHLADWDTT
jgi:glyoxylase-like metal-dependent hydrolase (beta-lactamase superfamily II)